MDCPPSIRAAKALSEVHRLPGLLPYERYDPDTGLFHNADSIGFVLEAVPAAGLSEAQIKALSGLFTQGLKPGTSVQVSLYASPEVLPLLERWARARTETRDHPAAEMFELLAQKRLHYLRRYNWRSLLSEQAMLVRDFRLLVSVARPKGSLSGNIGEADYLKRTRETVKGVLASAGLPAWALDAEAFLNVMDVILNPWEDRRAPLRWDPERLLAEQMVDGETLLLVGRDALGLSHGEHHVDIRLHSVRQYPHAWAGWGMTDLAGDLLSNTLRLPCPFLYTLTVHVPDQAMAAQGAKLKAARATQMADSPMGKFVPAWLERKQDWSFVNRMVDSGHKLLHASFQVLLFPPQGEGEHAEQRLRALFEAKGWGLQKDRFINLHAFLSALPMMAGPTFIQEMNVLGRMRRFLTWSCVNTAPVAAEWKGTRSPLLMLVGRRGQVMFLDPFDNAKGNFNIACAAASGAGKSFFTQEVVMSLLGTGGRVWVIDSGRSYQKLCQLLGGTYLEFGPKALIRLNPFTGIRDIGEEMPLLKGLIAQMAAPAQGLNSLQTARLEEAIGRAWEAHGNQATVTEVAEHLSKHEDEAARRVGVMLYPYTRAGTYGRYFDGHANIDLDNLFVVLELSELDAKPDLQAVVLLMLMMRITEAMYLGDRNQRKLCIIEEAWRLMSGGNAGDFIEQGYRTARKFGGAFMTVTQGIEDYYRSGTSKAALDNADWMFLLRQKPESLKAAEKSDRLVMDENLRRLLSGIDTRQGKYSEIAVMGPEGTTVGRLVVDPFAEKLYSTKAQEFAAIEALMNRGMSLVDSVERVAAAGERR